MTGQAEEILLETALAYEHLFSQDSLKKWDIFGPLYTKNPPQIVLRGIFVEHRRIELLTF